MSCQEVMGVHCLCQVCLNIDYNIYFSATSSWIRSMKKRNKTVIGEEFSPVSPPNAPVIVQTSPELHACYGLDQIISCWCFSRLWCHVSCRSISVIQTNMLSPFLALFFCPVSIDCSFCSIVGVSGEWIQPTIYPCSVKVRMHEVLPPW
jgi:hypothetical protein